MALPHHPSTGRLLDDLVVKRPGPGVRAIGLVMRGVRKVSDQVPPYTDWWNTNNHQNVDALLASTDNDGDPPAAPRPQLVVSIGDSSALGIGATAPELSYIGQLVGLLNGRPLLGSANPPPDPRAATVRAESTPWIAVNLSMSGARVRDGLDRQLPQMQRLIDAGLAPDLVICCLGSNDVFWGSGNRRQSSTQRNARLRDELTELIERLPDKTVVGHAAGRSERGQLANQAIRVASEARGLTHLNPWKGDGGPGRPRLSEDRFHLNEYGYEVMAHIFQGAAVPPTPPPA